MQSHYAYRVVLVMACLGSWVLLMAGCPVIPTPQVETVFKQVNLVSDGSQPNTVTDSNLVNPWGLVQRPAGPFWIADNAKGVATVYNGAGQPFPVGTPLIVTIPVASGGTSPAPPTGIVFNSFADTGDFGGNLFIFVTEDGTIAAWKESDGTTATLEVNNFKADNTGPVYKGAAMITNTQGNFLVVTDFRDARIDVFDKNFASATLSSSFTDGTIPTGFAPFNVQVLGGKVYITYAKQNDAKHDDVSGAGNGFVNEFDTNGALVRRIASNGTLNSPWGLAIGPSTWGKFAGALLVGNFGDGKIGGFSLGTSPAFIGTLKNENNEEFVNLGLWSIVPGNGAEGSDSQKLYLTAGGSGEDHGLFAELQVSP